MAFITRNSLQLLALIGLLCFALPGMAETLPEAYRVLQGYQKQIIDIQQKQIPLHALVDELQNKIESEKVRNAEVIKEYRTARRELESARISGLPAALKNAQFNFMLAERRYEKSSGPLEGYREKLKKTLATISEYDQKINDLEQQISKQNKRIAELSKSASQQKAATQKVVASSESNSKALKESRIREKQAKGEIERLKTQLAELKRTKFKTDPTADSRKHAIRQAMRMQLMMAQADPNDLRDDMTVNVKKIGTEGDPIELVLKYKGSGQYVGQMVMESGEYKLSLYQRVVESNAEGSTEINLKLKKWSAHIPLLDHKATHNIVYDTTVKPAEIRIYNNQFIKELGAF